MASVIIALAGWIGSRSLTLRAAERADRGRSTEREFGMAKRHATRAALENANDAYSSTEKSATRPNCTLNDVSVMLDCRREQGTERG